jgi:ELWxxDGT repeat protein
MKLFLLLLAAFSMAVTSHSQVTLISNNTNLQSGFVFNGKAILISNNDSIWTTDGTSTGTYKLLDNVMYADSGGVVFNNLFFFAGVTTIGAELWKTDGTAAGTQLVKDIIPGTSSSGPTDFMIYNNKVYFTADNATNGRELWTTDGTAAGTQMVKDINAGSTSGLSLNPSFTLAGSYMYFIANDGIHGEEIWKSDGTSAGTSLVADLTAGSTSSNFYWRPFAVLGTGFLFTTITASDFSLNLWNTNGTTEGTALVKNFGANSAALGFYFGADSYYKFNSKVYFTVNSGSSNPQVWVSDGTTAGTVMVKEMDAELWNSITIGNKFYFSGGFSAGGGGIWVSDGTTAGTSLLKDVFPGLSSSFYFNLQPFDFTTGYSDKLFNGKFFFIAVNNTDYQLWITDGTSAGTSKVTDMNSAGGSEIGYALSYYYTSAGLYFTANKGSGVEPWFTNGTVAGTSTVADINPGLESSNPIYLFIYNDKLFLNATNGDNTGTVINTDLYVLTSRATVLPVTLLQFSASKAADAIHLQWLTQAQDNMDYYQVERSIDGANFTSIGRVNAISSYAASQAYSLDDKEALTLNQPILYYRLRLVENNGSYKYSNIVKIDLNNAAFSVTLSPNPVSNTAYVTVNGARKGKLQIDVIDLSGRVIRQLNKAVDNRVIQIPVDVSGLAPGSYLLRIINENNTKVQPFIKQ